MSIAEVAAIGACAVFAVWLEWLLIWRKNQSSEQSMLEIEPVQYETPSKVLSIAIRHFLAALKENREVNKK